jgi:hypothetical protein
VTCDGSDGAMSLTHDAAEEFGIPNLLLHTQCLWALRLHTVPRSC